MDNVDVIGTVAAAQTAALVSIAALGVVGPREDVKRADGGVLRNPLTGFGVVCEIGRVRDPIGGAGRSR